MTTKTAILGFLLIILLASTYVQASLMKTYIHCDKCKAECEKLKVDFNGCIRIPAVPGLKNECGVGVECGVCECADNKPRCTTDENGNQSCVLGKK